MEIAAPQFKIPSRNKIISVINEKSKNVLNSLVKMISNCKMRPSITIDGWTGQNKKSDIAATVHFYWELKLKSGLLFIKEMPLSHTSENIRNKFDDICLQLGIQYFVISTDNAANMKKAFKFPLILSNKLEENPSMASKKLNLFEDSSSESKEEEEEIENLSVDFGTTNVFWESIKCSAHTLQLVVHDGIAALSKSNDVRPHQALKNAN